MCSGSCREHIQWGRHSDDFIRSYLDLQAKTKTAATSTKNPNNEKNSKSMFV